MGSGSNGGCSVKTNLMEGTLAQHLRAILEAVLFTPLEFSQSGVQGTPGISTPAPVSH